MSINLQDHELYDGSGAHRPKWQDPEVMNSKYTTPENQQILSVHRQL